MKVTESRFQLKRRQNSVPEELEPDTRLELEDLRWISGPSFIHTYIFRSCRDAYCWIMCLPQQVVSSLCIYLGRGPVQECPRKEWDHLVYGSNS